MTDLWRSFHGVNVLIGIDDTDNLQSRGTGFLAQRLLATLEEEGLGSCAGATRHQLLVDPRIAYTSHNSSACICWNGGPEPRFDGIVRRCGELLEAESAPGSDPGLIVATPAAWDQPDLRRELVAFGRQAQREVLDQAQARALASACELHLSGHGGDEGGVIGALAGVGLHLSGSDGFFLWMPGIRGLEGQRTYGDLLAEVPIDVALDPSGAQPRGSDLIELGDWVRPIWQEGRAVLLLEPHTAGWTTGDEVAPWHLAPRAVVKRH